MKRGESSTSDELHLVVPGSVDYLDRIRDFVTRNAQDAGLQPDQVDAVVLSMDEAVANIVEHAYEEMDVPEDDRIIAIDIQNTDTCFTIRLRDQGQEFNPTVLPDVDLDEHLAEFRTGGLGIHFMRELMDELSHRYIPGTGNELIMKKYSGRVSG